MVKNEQQTLIQILSSPWAWVLPLLAASSLFVVWWQDANRELFFFFNQFSHYTGGWLWQNITTFGDSLVIFSLALLFIERRPQLIWTLLFSALVSTLMVHGLKEWALVMRPPAVLSPDQLTVIGIAHKAVSFPSGHTTAAFTMAALLCLQPIARHWKALVLSLAILVGISRMAVGVHWPMDVLGGALIAWVATLSAYYFAPRISWGAEDSAQRLFAVLLLGAAVSLSFFHDSGYAGARWLEITIGLVSMALALPKLKLLFTRRSPRGSMEVSEEEIERAGGGSSLGVVLRIVITLLIFGLIFRSIDFDGVTQSIQNIVPRLLLLGILFQLLSTTLAAYRWSLVMRPLGYEQSFGFFLKSYFKGTFFNQGLPTSIGGDAIRVLDVARKQGRKRDAFNGVFIDRVLGLVGLLLLNLLANAINPDLLPHGVFITVNLLIASGILGFIVLFYLQRLAWLDRWRVTRLFQTISSRLSVVLPGPRELGSQLALSVAVHFLALMAIFLIGRSVELEYDLLTFFIVVPPVILLTLIPLSLAGWGIRESAMIGFFTLLGADKVTVLAMSIVYGVVLILASLPGLVVYLKGRYSL